MKSENGVKKICFYGNCQLGNVAKRLIENSSNYNIDCITPTTVNTSPRKDWDANIFFPGNKNIQDHHVYEAIDLCDFFIFQDVKCKENFMNYFDYAKNKKRYAATKFWFKHCIQDDKIVVTEEHAIQSLKELRRRKRIADSKYGKDICNPLNMIGWIEENWKLQNIIDDQSNHPADCYLDELTRRIVNLVSQG